MLRRILSLFLCFSLLLPLDSFGQIWPEAARMFAGKKGNTDSCFDFSKPHKIATPKGSMSLYKRGHSPGSKKKNAVNECEESVTKERKDLEKEIKEIKADIKKVVEKKYKQGNKAVHSSDLVDANRDKQNRLKSKKYRGALLCRLLNREHPSACMWKLNGKHRKSKEHADGLKKRVNKQVQELKDQEDDLATKEVELEDKELFELFDGLEDDMFAEFQKKQDEDLAKNMSKNHKENGSERKKFTDKPIDEQKELMFKRDPKFVKDYLKNHLPEADALIKKQEELKSKIKKLKVLAKHLCSNKQVACPLVKEQFSSYPSKENFEAMISTLGNVFYTDKENNTLTMNVTLDNYEEYKKNRKESTNSELENKIEEKYEAAKKARDVYQENQKNKTDPTYVPKTFKAPCGGCADLNKLYEKLKAEGNLSDIQNLLSLYEEVKCIPPKVVASCEDAASATFKKHGFVEKAGEKSITIEAALDTYLKNPQMKGDAFVKAFDEVQLTLKGQFKEGSKKKSDLTSADPCPACEIVEKRLQTLAEKKEQEEEIETEDENGKLTKSTITSVKHMPKADLKPDQQAEFAKLRELAVSKKCIDADEWPNKVPNSCEEKAGAVKDLMLKYDDIDNDLDALSEVDQKVAELEKFQQESKQNCCEKVIGDLSSEFKGARANRNYLANDSIQLQLAEKMKCMNCGQNKNNEKGDGQFADNNPHINCDYYKRKIEKQNTGTIKDLLDPKTGGEYHVEDFKANEVFICKDGPKKSHFDKNRDWDVLSYNEEGKYGDFAGLNMKCYIDPGSKLTVNLTCCDLEKGSPEFENFKKELVKSSSALKGAVGTGKTQAKSALNNWIALPEAQQTPNTFCRDVWATYKEHNKNETTKGWQICVDYKNNEYMKVNPDYKFDGKSQGGTFKPAGAIAE